MRSPPVILHYHAVGDVASRLDPHNLVIDPDQLTEHLSRIRRRRYRFVPLSELTDALAVKKAGGLCALTFDDGSADNLSILPELLHPFRAPATVYACPGLLGRPHHAIAPGADVRLLTAEELRELARREEFEIGSHTRTHSDLGQASYAEALAEMSASKSELEELIGRQVNTFAYPYCPYSPACPRAARDAGYSSAVTCGNRGSWDPFALRRVSPDRLDTSLTFWLRTRYMWELLRSSSLQSAVARRVRGNQTAPSPEQ